MLKNYFQIAVLKGGVSRRNSGKCLRNQAGNLTVNRDYTIIGAVEDFHSMSL